MLRVSFKKIHEHAKLPLYASTHAVGADLYCIENFVLPVGAVRPTIVPTGLELADISTEFELQIRPRSGLASKGIIVVNSPGTIDPDYRGEIKVIMMNLSGVEQSFRQGDRIAQLVISRFSKLYFEFTQEGTTTERGSGGFGSTGISEVKS